MTERTPDEIIAEIFGTEEGRRDPYPRYRALREQARSVIARFGVKAGGPDAPARSLSGGNLQKFIVGREIDAAPKLLVVSQPV